MDIVDIFNKGGYEVIIRATQAPKDAYKMSTLLPSFIVFLELKQAKFFWSVLLIFGKTEAFLFHFLYSSCLSLTHSVLHGLYIILYIWDAVFSMCGTNFHNGGAY